jgi:DNA replication protein DnaC
LPPALDDRTSRPGRGRPSLPVAATAHDPDPGRGVTAVAQREQLTYWGFLAELLLAECDDRDRRRCARRVKTAGFPREKWLSDFDFDANPNINAATINTLPAAIGCAKVNHYI